MLVNWILSRILFKNRKEHIWTLAFVDDISSIGNTVVKSVILNCFAEEFQRSKNFNLMFLNVKSYQFFLNSNLAIYIYIYIYMYIYTVKILSIKYPLSISYDNGFKNIVSVATSALNFFIYLELGVIPIIYGIMKEILVYFYNFIQNDQDMIQNTKFLKWSKLKKTTLVGQIKFLVILFGSIW